MNVFKSIKDHLRDFNRSVLSDRQIMKYNRKGLLIEGPLQENQIQPNSIDLTLDNTYKVLSPNDTTDISDYVSRPCINPLNEIKYETGFFTRARNSREYYIIKPKEFVLMSSKEVLNIPNGILSFVQGRSSVARIAIQTEQAGLIDAGFRGTITLEVFNQSEYPIYVYAGMRIAQVYFFKAQYSDRVYGPSKYNKYMNQIGTTGSKISNDPEIQRLK